MFRRIWMKIHRRRRCRYLWSNAEVFGTKSSDIDTTHEFSPQMLQNLERASEHESIAEDLAEVLSTVNVTVEHRTIIGVDIN